MTDTAPEPEAEQTESADGAEVEVDVTVPTADPGESAGSEPAPSDD